MVSSAATEGGESMKRVLLVLAVAGAAALAVASSASADPVKSPQAVLFEATCTGLGNVTLANTGPAHTEALQVVGTNTVVLVPFNGAPGIIAAGTAAGTSCTFAEPPPGFPNTMPVVIING
jgi:hypothetical protein